MSKLETKSFSRLVSQGFCAGNLRNTPQLSRLARWTPFSCAAAGGSGLALGNSLFSYSLNLCPCAITSLAALWAGSGWFFICLGILTATGGLTNRSIYDRVYNFAIRKITHDPPIPAHGYPRRFGCLIGGSMYVISGLGFLSGNPAMAFGPALFMIVFATIAGATQWCFASALYNGLAKIATRKKAEN